MYDVSVIMGIYNVENPRYLKTSIDSILTQSFRDFEFIICNDGSPDEIWNIILEYKRSDHRIVTIENDGNIGLAATLNKCIRKSSGRFIARQDADDISDSNRLAEQLQYLKLNCELGFVGSNVNMFDEDGKWGERNFKEFPIDKDFLFTLPFVHGSIMFKKEALEAVGGYRVAKETRRTEDYDMLMRMYAEGINGANIQKHLYSFREDKDTISRRKYKYRFDEAIVRWKRFRQLGLMPGAFPFVIKPLIVGLIPAKILNIIHRESFKE